MKFIVRALYITLGTPQGTTKKTIKERSAHKIHANLNTNRNPSEVPLCLLRCLVVYRCRIAGFSGPMQTDFASNRVYAHQYQRQQFGRQYFQTLYTSVRFPPNSFLWRMN